MKLIILFFHKNQLREKIWIFDSIDFGSRQNILNYNFDENSEVEFLKKKWFLNEIFASVEIF